MRLKTTLINPQQIFSKGQIAAGLTPPLGIAYLASFLLAHEYPIQIIDALGEDPHEINPFKKGAFLRGLKISEVVSKIDSDTHLVGISNLFSFAYPAVEVLCQEIRKAYPDKKIVLGGPHPSALYEDILKNVPEVDFIAIGEGEESLLGLLDYLEGNSKLDELSGLATRDESGNIIVLSSSKRIKNLNQDNIPFPARHLLPMENYIQAQEGHGPSSGRWTSILSSRGCPYGCTFCESRRTVWIARTPNDVVDEMEHCLKEWGINEFHFEDDNMTINKDRLIGICDEIINRGLKIKWQTPNGIRASVTNSEMLSKMRDSGCLHITLAPESGSERVLDEVIEKGKDFDLIQLKECGALAHKLGLKVAAYFIIGLPGETRKEVHETIKYAKELAKAGVDEVAFGLFIPLPGTPLWDVAKKKNQEMDFLDLLAVGDMNKAVSWNDELDAEELNSLRLKAYIAFHLTRMAYHPLLFVNSFINVLRNIEETKTERTLLQFLKRFGIKKDAAPKAGPSLSAYPYDSSATVKTLLQSKPHYAYGHSLLKTLRFWKKETFNSKN
jgi:anaerobic magnesium-protoporphyrin IX monomethyl ester cyclase